MSNASPDKKPFAGLPMSLVHDPHVEFGPDGESIGIRGAVGPIESYADNLVITGDPGDFKWPAGGPIGSCGARRSVRRPDLSPSRNVTAILLA